MRDIYLNASDVNTFIFCRRALHLQQHGAASSLGRERAKGTAVHREHGERVRSSGRNRTAATGLAIAAAVLVLVALMLLR